MARLYQCLQSASVASAETKIAFDRFHIMQHVGNGVERVRKQEHKALLAQGDNTLMRSKYLWLYNAENMPTAAREKLARQSEDRACLGIEGVAAGNVELPQHGLG